MFEVPQGLGLPRPELSVAGFRPPTFVNTNGFSAATVGGRAPHYTRCRDQSEQARGSWVGVSSGASGRLPGPTRHPFRPLTTVLYFHRGENRAQRSFATCPRPTGLPPRLSLGCPGRSCHLHPSAVGLRDLALAAARGCAPRGGAGLTLPVCFPAPRPRRGHERQ